MKYCEFCMSASASCTCHPCVICATVIMDEGFPYCAECGCIEGDDLECRLRRHHSGDHMYRNLPIGPDPTPQEIEAALLSIKEVL